MKILSYSFTYPGLFGALALAALTGIVACTNFFVSRNSTSIRYPLKLTPGEFRILKSKVNDYAHTEKFTADEMNANDNLRSASWRRGQTFWKFGPQPVGIFLYSPSSSANLDKRFAADLVIDTFSAENASDWEQIAKSVEPLFRDFEAENKAILSLSITLYGGCSSLQRPNKKDVRCQMEVPMPIDFEMINSKILSPRVRGLRSLI